MTYQKLHPFFFAKELRSNLYANHKYFYLAKFVCKVLYSAPDLTKQYGLEFRSKKHCNYRYHKLDEIFNANHCLSLPSIHELLCGEYPIDRQDDIIQACLYGDNTDYDFMVINSTHINDGPARNRKKELRKIGLDVKTVHIGGNNRTAYIDESYVFKNEEDITLARLSHLSNVVEIIDMRPIRKNLQQFFNVPIPGISRLRNDIP